MVLPTAVPPACPTCGTRSWNDLLTETEVTWLVLPEDGGEHQRQEKARTEERDADWLCLNGHRAGALTEQLELLLAQSISRELEVRAQHSREHPDLVEAPPQLNAEGVSMLKRIVDAYDGTDHTAPVIYAGTNLDEAIDLGREYLARLANPDIPTMT